jgi:hypothetical protein
VPTAGEILRLSWALGVPFDTVLGRSPMRDRLKFAARSSATTTTSDEDLTAEIREEMIFLAELASELSTSGYLTVRE